MSDRVCANCKYFAPVNDVGGECRRDPPVIVDAIQARMSQADPLLATRFPAVRPADWCGEWGAKPNAH